MLWILWLILGVIIMVVSIAVFKIHPFIVITIVAILVGLLMGMPLVKSGKTLGVVNSLTKGMGGTLGGLAFIIAFGVMMGKFLVVSGGGKKIATTFINKFGKKRLHWALGFAALLIGLPVFFDVGFLLLIPMILTIAVEAKVSLMTVAIPFLAGLSTAHGLIPPHPAATFAVNNLNANMGMTILIGLAVAIPTVMVSGPIYGKFISKFVDKKATLEMVAQTDKHINIVPKEKQPSFMMALSTILVPIIIMVIGSIIKITITNEDNFAYKLFTFFGQGVIALLIGAIYSFVALGLYRGLKMSKITMLMDNALKPTITILLVTGAGGAFKGILIDSGIVNSIKDLVGTHLNSYAIIAIAWGIAALLRISMGSATTAMITAVGISSAFVGVNPTLLVLAIGGGSLIFSHVNDSGFWLIKSFFNLSIKETFLTWTMMETILSIVVLIMCLLFNTFLPLSF